MPVESFAGGGWLQTNEEAHDELDASGWLHPAVLVDLPGEVVSGHPDRHVRRVVGTDEHVVFLKREHRIPWRERGKNWLAGFGLVTKSEREARVLMRVGDRGPKWLAFGEDGRGRAFLLLTAIPGIPLTHYLRDADDAERARIGQRVGEWLGELHHLGVHQPDLYAKHLWIDPQERSIRALDWQRAHFRRHITAVDRIQSLSALAGSFSPEDRFLIAVSEAAGVRVADLKPRRTPRPAPEDDREPIRFIWIDEEAICAVPDVEADLRHSDMRALIDMTPDQEIVTAEVRLPVSGIMASLVRRRFRWPVSRTIAKLRGRNWRAPELITARQLVEQHRAGRSGPRLLGFGQRLTRFGGCSFLLTQG